MIIGTHARIAKYATDNYFSYYKRALIIFGAVIPDFNWFSLPHRGDNLGAHISQNEEKIRSTQSNFVKYIRLGNMLHYLCDYFCYAHKDNMDISHGTCHTKYEIKIGRLFKMKLYQKIKNMPPQDKYNLYKHFKQMKEQYEKKTGYSKQRFEICFKRC